MEQYAKAGADLLFIESPESEEEMRTIGRAFDLPLVANMVEGGAERPSDPKDLASIGYRFSDLSGDCFFSCDASFSRASGRPLKRKVLQIN
jgi:2-methylisocitrate lyase-like PEP mutase family enzyme